MEYFSYVIKEENGKIAEISLKEKSKNKSESVLEKKCRKEIKEFLSGKRKKFSVPIILKGTEFQKNVWKEIKKIPYGQTLSYKKISVKIKKPNAYRAVANACGANKIPIIIPCHRVVASNDIGGYSAGIEIKKKLLKLESKNKS